MRQHDESDVAPQDDELLSRAAAELRRPLRVNAALFDARVMDEVLRAPSGLRARMLELTRPRVVRVSPLLAIAAGLLFAVALAGSVLYVLPAPRRVASTSMASTNVASTNVASTNVAGTAAAAPVVQFGFVAPHASSVALVGDFNNWDPKATPLRAASTGGVWSVEVPVPPGRHLYAFVVDGTVWRPDPAAPLATGEDYGEPNSALTVAEPGAR